ncbi:MAG: aspartate kinase [Cytophagaceae bacterium]|nr:aspartate kinase [Cytophagaceae bacterium]|tara:strand:+ start:5444 stop:6772 length:1329 start_codon:yes stop_codon:yes gene_type:complete
MQVLKFGGTSVGSAANIERVGEILNQTQGTKVVVLSAMSGVTNLLVQIYEAVIYNKPEDVDNGIDAIRFKHFEAVNLLFSEANIASQVLLKLDDYLEELKAITVGDLRPSTYAEIVTLGESMSTYMISAYLNHAGLSNVLLDAKEFMYVGQVENPSIATVSEKLQPILVQNPSQIYITQGFVCRDEQGTVTTLKRGGSDFSATIIGAAVDASEVQIWTDIDGLHNNDPRYVDGTKPIDHLTYNEAAELAYFGAKILHPQTVAPVIDRDIPVWLKNTFEPQAHGTKISNEYHNRGLKAISAKDDITAIKIRSNRMLGAHGFLRTIFEVFDRHETSIDMITTSEVAISLTIDNAQNLQAIVTELSVIAEITVEQDHSIICIVGENLIEDQTSYKAFGLLNNLPVRMISYGGSNNNISLLVPTKEKVNALRYLNQQLFQLQEALA